LTDSNYTALVIVLDRSGSMDDIRTDAQGSLNQFIRDQKAEPGKATLTLVQFDSGYELVHLNTPLGEVPEIVLHPRGSTALLDAVGFTVGRIGESLASMSENDRPGKVLVAIVTDGHENASREWTYDSVKRLIDEQRDKWGWEFIYLAADENAVHESAKMGIGAGATHTWVGTAKGVRAAGQSLNSYSSSYRSTGVGKFDDENKE